MMIETIEEKGFKLLWARRPEECRGRLQSSLAPHQPQEYWLSFANLQTLRKWFFEGRYWDHHNCVLFCTRISSESPLHNCPDSPGGRGWEVPPWFLPLLLLPSCLLPSWILLPCWLLPLAKTMKPRNSEPPLLSLWFHRAPISGSRSSEMEEMTTGWQVSSV